MDEADDGLGSEVNSPRDGASNGDHVSSTFPLLEPTASDVSHTIADTGPPCPITSTPMAAGTRPHRRTAFALETISPIRERDGTSAAKGGRSTVGDPETPTSSETDGSRTPTVLVSDLASALSNKQLEVLKLKADHTTLTEQMAAKESEVVTVLQKLSKTQGELERTDADLRSVQKELSRYKKLYEAKEGEVASYRERLTEAEQKIEALSNVELSLHAELSEGCMRVLQEGEQVKEHMNELEQQVADSNKTLDDCQKEYACMKEKLAAVLAERTILEEKLDAEQRKADEIREEQEREMADLQRQIEELLQKLVEESERHGKEEEAWKTDREDFAKRLEDVKKDLKEKLRVAIQEKETVELERNEIRNEKRAIEKEKSHLMRDATKSARDLAAAREECLRLRTDNREQLAKLEDFARTKITLENSRKELMDANDQIANLKQELELTRENAKKDHDEVLHLRNEKKKLASMAPVPSALDTELKEQCASLNKECDRLNVQIESERKQHELELKLVSRDLDSMKAESEKHKKEISRLDEELNGRLQQLKKLEVEGDAMKREISNLKTSLNDAATALDKANDEFVTFRRCAERQYEVETAELNVAITERDARIERLQSRIAAYESYPGRSGASSPSRSLRNIADVTTVWDAIPESIREQLAILKERYEELDDVVRGLMKTNLSAISDALGLTLTRIVVPPTCADKSTECGELTFRISEGGARHAQAVSSETLVEDEEIITAGGSAPRTEEVTRTDDHLFRTLMTCVDSKKLMNVQLSRNVQQLLLSLLVDVRQCDAENTLIADAVDRFFVNLDMLMRRAFAASEDVRRKCDSLEKERTEHLNELKSTHEDLRLVRERCISLQTKIENSELLLKEEKRTHVETRNQLEQASEEYQQLKGELEGIKLATTKRIEIKNDLQAQATSALQQMERQLTDWEEYANGLNEKLREANRMREALRRSLSERETEIARLGELLITRTEEGTQRCEELRRLGEEMEGHRKEVALLRKKCDKREGFLNNLETILEKVLSRNSVLRHTNRLRQDKIDEVSKILSEYGLGDRTLAHSLAQYTRNGVALGSVPGGGVPKAMDSKFAMNASRGMSDIPTAKLERLRDNLHRSDERIERLERESGVDDLVILNWRNAEAQSRGTSPSPGFLEPL